MPPAVQAWSATPTTLRNKRPLSRSLTSTLTQQGAQADLVQDPLAGEGFGEHADHEAEHRCAAVEQFHPLQLLPVDLGGSGGLVPGGLVGLAAAGGVGGEAAGHGWDGVTWQL